LPGWFKFSLLSFGLIRLVCQERDWVNFKPNNHLPEYRSQQSSVRPTLLLPNHARHTEEIVETKVSLLGRQPGKFTDLFYFGKKSHRGVQKINGMFPRTVH
jgi:hypothetical protein